jgi:hypothetical protein
MKGHFYRRGCKCKKKKCSCSSKWAFTIDIGVDPVTGKRKQKVKSGFNTKQEAEESAGNSNTRIKPRNIFRGNRQNV